MEKNFASSAVAGIHQQRSTRFGNTVLQAILHLQKLNGCSMNSLKKYLASQHGIDCQDLDAAIKPIMKMAMDRNILKKLGDTGKVSESKRRAASSTGRKRRRRSPEEETSTKSRKRSTGRKTRKSTGRKGRKSTGRKGRKSTGRKGRKTSGRRKTAGKRRARRAPKNVVPDPADIVP